jgi:xylulokinase
MFWTNFAICSQNKQTLWPGSDFPGKCTRRHYIDKGGQVIRPAILWNDTRSHVQAAELDAIPVFRDLTGNIVFPGFTAPKILWMQQHEPALFAQIDKVLLPKDYLRLWLTGQAISEMSDASGTSWLDVKRRDWSDTLLAATGLSRENMPELIEGSAVGGGLRDSLAARWNLPKSIPVAGGAGDNSATAIGLGVVKAGQAFASLGTSGVLFAANDAYSPNPDSAVHAFCHALPQTWHQMGVILVATDALEWYSAIVGENAAQLTNELGSNLRKPGRLQFLPYLGGERTPHNDADIRGAFTGLAHGDDRATLSHAVLQGVGFAFRDNLSALQAAGTQIDALIAVGGGSRSQYWLGLLANILNIPINVPEDGDFGAGFGAARLGLMAATGADATDVCVPPIIAQVIEP